MPKNKEFKGLSVATPAACALGPRTQVRVLISNLRKKIAQATGGARYIHTMGPWDIAVIRYRARWTESTPEPSALRDRNGIHRAANRISAGSAVPASSMKTASAHPSLRK